MRQLTLDISPRGEPTLDSFVPGANREALEQVVALARGALREAILYLWGEQGSGRTHLLRAAGRANPSLVIADDVDLMSEAGLQELFLAINAAREGGAPVLAAGHHPPAQLRLREDLRTRLGWGLVYQLRPLTDAHKAIHLRGVRPR
ncbi:MAG TPA: DnaA regulatory inactivator Hda, partial [Burkholderiales bacterium]|nr:DnaA regulatory inactivator Hda [Burkholderiales bacterium]